MFSSISLPLLCTSMCAAEIARGTGIMIMLAVSSRGDISPRDRYSCGVHCDKRLRAAEQPFNHCFRFALARRTKRSSGPRSNGTETCHGHAGAYTCHRGGECTGRQGSCQISGRICAERKGIETSKSVFAFRDGKNAYLNLIECLLIYNLSLR
jgi:hypothetical protein